MKIGQVAENQVKKAAENMADTERRTARQNRIAQEIKMPSTKNGVGKVYDDKLSAVKSSIPGLPTTPTVVKPTDIHSGTPNLDITRFFANNSQAAQPATSPKTPKITVTKADIGSGDGKTSIGNLAALLPGKVSPEQAIESAKQNALQATEKKYADYDAIYSRYNGKKLTGSDRAIVNDAMQRLGKVMNDSTQTVQDRAIARNAWNRLNTLDRFSSPLTYTAGQVASGMENTLGSIAGGALQAAGDVVGKVTGRTDVGSAGIQQLEKYFQANPQDAPTNVNVADQHYIARIAQKSGVSASAVQSYLENARGALTANFNNNVLGQSVSEGYKNTVGKAAQQIGQQIPGLLLGVGASPSASAESGLVSKLLNKEGLGTALKTALKGNVATYLIGASSYSQKINQLARQNNVKAGDYADALGTAFVEYFTEGLFGFSDLNSYKALFNGATGNAKSSIVKAVGKYLLSASEEGLEEVVADPMESAIDKAFVNHSIPLMGKGGIFDAQQMLSDGVNGAAVALIMGGVANISGIYSTYQESRNIQQAASELNSTISAFNQETGASIEPVDASSMTQEQLDTKAAEVLNGLATYAAGEETNAPTSTQNEKATQSVVQPALNDAGKLTPPTQQNAATGQLNASETEKRTTANSENAIQSILGGNKRVSQDSLTQEQFDRVADAGGEIDGAGKAYIPQPEQHIDNRDMNSVGKSGVNAFQFDHPALHSYFQQAAKDLLNDAQASLDTPAVRRTEYTMQGKRSIQEIAETPQLRSAMNEAGLSRSQIMDAAQLLINDHGQENVAAAKRLELILDDMLVNGYTTVYGNTVEPNEKYIKAKSEIAGSNPAQHESVIPDELDAVPEDKKTAPGTGPEANEGLSGFTEQEATNLLASAKNKILGFGTSISDFVKSAISTKGNNERLYLGKFPESAVKMVRDKTGLNISGFSSIMNGTEAWHAYKDHSNTLTEEQRGQIPLTEDDFSFLPDILSDPDSVSLSPDPDAGGRVALIFTKKIGDKYVTVQGYSKGKKGLIFDTMWINKGKPPVTADTDVNISQSQTSETSAGTASTDNVAQAGKESKGENVETPGDAPKGFDPLSRLQGEQRPSQMHPVNEQAAERTQEERRRAPSDIPKTNLEGRLTSKHASTLANTPVTTNEMAAAIEQELANGNFSRIKYTDSAAASTAEKHIERISWEAAWAEYRADVKAGKSSKDIVALGQALYNNAVNSNDLMSAMDIASMMVQNAKTTAQALQAMNMINRATPESRLYMVEKSVENLDQKLEEKFGQNNADKAAIDAKDAISEETGPAAKTATDPTAYDLIHNIYEALKTGKSEAPAELWLRDTATELSSKLQQNAKDKTPANAQTTMQTMLNDLLRITKDAAPQGKKASGNRSIATETLRNFWSNKESYESVVQRAQRYINEKYSGNPQALSVFNDWLSGNGVNTWNLIGRAIGENGVKLQNILTDNWQAKDEALDKVTKAILSDTSLTEQDASQAAQAISDRFYTELSERSQKKLESIFKQRTPSAKRDLQQKLSNFFNLGAFSDEAFNSLAAEKATGYKGITLDKDLLQNYYDALRSTDKAEQNEAWLAIEQNIADQIPATWQDKLNAWRYLSMLGNPRTHIRNIAGNAGFYPVRMLKNLIATGIESAANIDGRTKAILNPASADDKALLQAGWSDYGNVVDTIQAGGKYDDNYGDVDNLRTIFNFKPLEKARKANGAALDIEDTWFSRPVYAESLAGWLKANGHTAAEFQNGSLSEDTMNEARAYAVKEAQKATYRDVNDFSQWVSHIGNRHGSDNKTGKVAKILAEGVLPFKKTPANILVRGVEYSPVGLGKGIYDMTKGVKSGKVTAAEAIDTLSSGMTGTVLAGLGFLLAKLGLATGSADDDDKQKNFDKLRGGQDYALTIGDHNFTIDWLAPEALPFFTGIEIYNYFADNDGYTPAEAFQSFQNLAEPILETSMLSSLEDIISSVKYADGNYLGTMASTAVTSYLSQFLPTIGGQIERTFGNSSDKRTETFRYGNTDTLGTDVSYTLGQALNKVPGLDYGQIPYIDAWGRTQDQGNIVSRAINNFLNPSYVSKDRSAEVDDELQRLYDAGFSTVLPERAAQSTKINGDYLTKDEYVSYNKVKGQTALSLVSRFMNSSDYRKFTDEERADAIADIYTYANDRAKKSILESRGETYDSDWDAESELSDIPQYLAVKDSFSKASKNRDYTTIDALIPKYSNLTDKAKDVLDSSAGRLDQIAEAQSAGVDSEQWYAAYDVWKDIYDTKKDGYSATDKATDFAKWVDGTSMTDDQKTMLKDQLTYSSGYKATAKSYESLTGAGLSSEAAADVYSIVSSLTPTEGKSTVSTKQKFSAISTMGDLDDKQKMLAMFGFDTDTDNTYERYDAASKAGISTSDWSTMTGKLDSSISQADLKGAIGSMPWSASQKRAAWNIYKAQKKWKASSPW